MGNLVKFEGIERKIIRIKTIVPKSVTFEKKEKN